MAVMTAAVSLASIPRERRMGNAQGRARQGVIRSVDRVADIVHKAGDAGQLTSTLVIA